MINNKLFYKIVKTSKKENGFSVINIIITIAIAGIITAVATYDLKNLDDQDIEKEARRLQQWFNELRNSAISDGKGYFLHVSKLSGILAYETNRATGVEIYDCNFDKTRKEDLDYIPSTSSYLLNSSNNFIFCINSQGLVKFNHSNTYFRERTIILRLYNQEKRKLDYMGMQISYLGSTRLLTYEELIDKGLFQ